MLLLHPLRQYSPFQLLAPQVNFLSQIGVVNGLLMDCGFSDLAHQKAVALRTQLFLVDSGIHGSVKIRKLIGTEFPWSNQNSMRKQLKEAVYLLS